MLTPARWRVVAAVAFAVWVVSLLVGRAAWLALASAAVWLMAMVMSQPRPAKSASRRTIRRLRRNLKWLPGNTFFGVLVGLAGWWWLSFAGPSGWSLVAFGVVWPPLAMWLMASGRIGFEQSVEVDDEEIRVVEGDETVQVLRWTDLEQVDVRTTSAGPWNEDMFWVLSPAADGATVVVPHDHAVAEVVPRLLRLPGFDYEQVAESLGSVSEATFVLWRRQSAPSG